MSLQLFAERLVEVISVEDDYIWIHDYHLLVLPSLLRKKFNRMRCGLFLHSPFPSSEMFRTFPKREELLRSMLNADLVGEAQKRRKSYRMPIYHPEPYSFWNIEVHGILQEIEFEHQTILTKYSRHPCTRGYENCASEKQRSQPVERQALWGIVVTSRIWNWSTLSEGQRRRLRCTLSLPIAIDTQVRN